MKRDKISVVFIVIVSCVITGVLQYSKSSETLMVISSLTAPDGNLCVSAEEDMHKLYSQLKPDVEDTIIPIEYFIEEQRIIDEFDNKKRIEPILCRNEPTDYISFYMSLTNEMNMYGGFHKLKMDDAGSCETFFTAPHRSISIANSNRYIIHKIKANDSLFKLAKKYYHDGSKWKKIYQANRDEMSDPNSLTIGQELVIPKITVSSKEDKHRVIKT
jgi:hypothetical protein